jgi:hypothetical protein
MESLLAPMRAYLGELEGEQQETSGDRLGCGEELAALVLD